MIKGLGVDERLQSTIVQAYGTENTWKSTQNFPGHRYLGKVGKRERERERRGGREGGERRGRVGERGGEADRWTVIGANSMRSAAAVFH